MTPRTPSMHVLDEEWTIQALVRDLAARGDAPAVIAVRGDEAEATSYGDIAAQAERLAGGLVRAGLARGEPVALFAPNSAQWVIARLGIAAAGALAVPIDDLAGEEELTRIIADSGARRVFTVRRHEALLRRIRNGEALRLAFLDGAEGEDRGGGRDWRDLFAETGEALPRVQPDEPAMLVYTSGTTGPPKSFTLSHRNLAANVDALLAEELVDSRDRFLVPLPLHHVYPFVVGMLTALASGAAIVLPESVTGLHIVAALRAGRATVIVGVPRLYAAVLSALRARVATKGKAVAATFNGLLDLSAWLRRRFGIKAGDVLFRGVRARLGPEVRLLTSGGAHLEAHIIWKLEALGWDVFSGYGLAETASLFTGNLPGRKRVGSEGRPLVSGSEVRIAEAEEADRAGAGEIQLRGPTVFAGYRDPEINRDAFTGDGWFRTGDLGYLDRDGFLYVTGRAKEMIVLGGGRNVFPEDLERIYEKSPYIAEIAVLEEAGALVGLVRPDLDEIRKSGSKRIEDVLRVSLNSLAQELPSHQRLSGFAITREALPRTRLGKYRRHLLPELYRKARSGAAPAAAPPLSEEDRALLEKPPAREVWQWLKARYADYPLAMDTSLQLDLGADSLEWVTLTLEIQQRFGVALDEAAVDRVFTVRDLLREIAAARPAEKGRPPGREALGEEEMKWLEPPGPLLSALGMGAYWVVWAIMRLFFRLRAEGAARVPEGPCVLVANHLSDLDPAALGTALPLSRMRTTHWGGDVERLFSNPVLRTVCRAANVFPVNERAPRASLAMAAEVLRRGHALIWFPEMWRSPDGRMQPFLPAVGRLLAQTGVPAVPVRIIGTFEAMPRWRRVPRPHPVRVVFGEPVTPETLAGGAGEDEAPERITKALRERVAALDGGEEDGGSGAGSG